MLLGWIPFIGFLAGIWTIILEILGIRELHEMTPGKAALAVIVAILVIAIIIIAIAALFFIAFSEVVMEMSPRQITGI
jgi:hypothetical protein